MDQHEQLVQQVRGALERKAPLAINGGGTKSFYGYPVVGEPLDLSAHSGVVEYDPGELVITCRSGTPLVDISEQLKREGQFLPFEPPAFGDRATLGGTVACGFSGPRRPWAGSLRDYLLGVSMINGAAQVVHYGGQVMKNVAGYDISRLLAGSMGTLGVILQISFKVLPMPARELTLKFNCDQREAIRRVNTWSGQPLPLSGAYWWQGSLSVRLSGEITQTEQAARTMRPDHSSEDCSEWQALREHRLAFFTQPGNLWRLSLPPAAEPVDLGENCLVDWGGAQRWYITNTPGNEIRDVAERSKGHATLFRAHSDELRFQPLPPALRAMQARVKQAFDPSGIFNPGRLSRDW